MHQVSSNDGTIIGYRTAGAGPPLILVHGATADHSRWLPLLPRLEPHFTVYAVDRRGRGASGDSAHYDLMREAEDVAAVVQAAGEPANLLGHSFGGLVSLEAALLTDRVRRLILYEPPILADESHVRPATLRRMEALVERGELEAALEVMMREVVQMPDHELAAYRQLPAWQIRITLAPTIPRELRAVNDYRFSPERFADLRVPTMLLLGGDSPARVVRETELIDAALPDSRVVILPNQQHVAMDMDPASFAGKVIDFQRG